MRIHIVLALLLITAAPAYSANTEHDSEHTSHVSFYCGSSVYSIEEVHKLERLDDFSKLPSELKAEVKQGERLGYKIYRADKLLEHASGTVDSKGELRLSNGAAIDISKHSVAETLIKLRAVYSTLHTPNFHKDTPRIEQLKEKLRVK